MLATYLKEYPHKALEIGVDTLTESAVHFYNNTIFEIYKRFRKEITNKCCSLLKKIKHKYD